VMRKARAIMMDDDIFTFAYGCASHAMSNLCRDVLKLPKALSALSFATAMAKYFSNRHLSRENLRAKRDKLSPKPPTLKLCGVRAARLRSARVCVANINNKGASGSAVRPLAKSRAGRESGGEALRGDSARLRSARESPTNSKGSNRLFEVRYSVYLHGEGKQSEVM
jgi:hypothetical protein